MTRFILLIVFSMCLVACGNEGETVTPDAVAEPQSGADSQSDDDYDDFIDEGMNGSLADDPAYGNLAITVADAVSELRSDCIIDVTRVEDIGVAGINLLLGLIEFTDEDQLQFNTGEIAMQRGWSAAEGESALSFAYEVPMSDDIDGESDFWTYDGAEGNEKTQTMSIAFNRQSFDYVTDTPEDDANASDLGSALIETSLLVSMPARNVTATDGNTKATVGIDYKGMCQLNIMGDGFESR